jgi:threonyl-tRNA synthetase
MDSNGTGCTKALDEGEINYTEKSGEAAFYGPKIDVQVWSTVGRKFTLATNQVDFAIPSLFGLITRMKEEKKQHRCVFTGHLLGLMKDLSGF